MSALYPWRRGLRATLAGCAAALLTATAAAQADKPISVVIAWPAGGPADVTGRTLLPAMQKALGQPFVVENLSGAGGSLGATRAREAKPDGQTVFIGTPLELVQTPMVLRTRYSSEDFRMVGPIGSTYLMLVVRNDLPAKDLGELVALAKKPGAKELSFGSGGRGTIYHLVAERFAQDVGVKLLHVPYKGAAQIVTDLTGGLIDMAFMPLGGPVASMVQSGKFRPIAYTGPARHPGFPNVPTMNETKLVKDFVFDAWAALMVPRATPDAVVGRLSAALNEALRQPAARTAIEGAGVIPAQPMTAADAEKFYTAETARYRAIGKAINLQPE